MLEQTIAAVVAALNRHKVPFIFFGMDALNVHLGRERRETFTTDDSDFLFDIGISAPSTILKILKKTAFPEPVFVVWREPGRTITIFDERKWKSPCLSGAGTFSICTSEGYYHLDLAFGDTGIPFEDVWRNSARITYFGVPIRLASKEHLLQMKRHAGRDKDLQLLLRLKLNERSGKPIVKKRK